METYKIEDDPFVPIGSILQKCLPTYIPDYFNDELTYNDLETFLLSIDPEITSNPNAFKMFIDYFINDKKLTDIAKEYGISRNNVRGNIKRIRPIIANYIKTVMIGIDVPTYKKKLPITITESFNKI